MKKSIETIEEVIALIEAEKEKVSQIDAENLSLSVLESGNTLYEQNERLRAITVALTAVANEETKNALNSEISSLQYSIKNLNRIDELKRIRTEHLAILKSHSEKLVSSFDVYKEKKSAFERRIGIASSTVMELLKSEKSLSNLSLPEGPKQQSSNTIPVEVPFMSGVSKKSTEEKSSLEELFSDPTTPPFRPDALPEEEIQTVADDTSDARVNAVPREADETDFVEEVVLPQNEEKKEQVNGHFVYSKPELNPILALAKVLRKFENLTGQLDSDKYIKRSFLSFREVLIEEPEKEAISRMFNEEKCHGLTDEQTKVIILSMPKEIITALGRKDILEMRKTAVESVYTKGFLNSEIRPKFTYKLISKLGNLILSDVSESELKIKVFFNENSDKIIKSKYGKENPDYRAFAVLKEEDLTNY